MKELSLENVMVAGGSVCNTIMNNDIRSDVDMFIYGLNSEDSTKKTKELIDKLMAYSKEHNYDYIILRSEHLIRINIFYQKEKTDPNYWYNNNKSYEIQIIFRQYKSKAEILHGFDMGSSSVGFTNDKIVYVTPLGAYVYKNMANIFDPSRMSPTYFRRLEKYYYRGFKILIPFADKNILTKMVRNRYGTSLGSPYEEVYISSSEGKDYIEFRQNSYYDQSYDKMPQKSEALAKYGIKYLAPVFKSYYHAYEYGDIMAHANDNIIVLLKDFIKDKFRIDTVKSNYQIKRVKFSTLYNLFTPDEVASLFSKYKAALDGDLETYNKEISAIRDKISINMIAGLEKYNNLTYSKLFENIKWKVDNPGEQLTSTLFPRKHSVKDIPKSIFSAALYEMFFQRLEELDTQSSSAISNIGKINGSSTTSSVAQSDLLGLEIEMTYPTEFNIIYNQDPLLQSDDENTGLLRKRK
jgi:hypothetical protein